MTIQKMLVSFALLLLLYFFAANNVSATVEIDWVTVGDPGNAQLNVVQADGTSGYGRVDYDYRIAMYEVTNGQYTEFLNAVAATDTNDLFWEPMQSEILGGISRFGTSGSYTYSTKTNMANKPVNFVSWYDCARFANWLHNGQPVGIQDASTTEDGAYTFIGFEVVGPRNANAEFFVPNEHEWVKAAFYQPGVITNDGDEWWLYPNASDTLPQQAVATPTGGVRNPGPSVLNYFHGASWNGNFEGNVVDVGSAGGKSYYGAYDMGGNVFEWTTADPNKPDPFNIGPYIVRGASYFNTYGHIRNNERNLGPNSGPSGGHYHSFPSDRNGFRLASYVPLPLTEIPEPSTLLITFSGIIIVCAFRRRPTLVAVLFATLLFPSFSRHTEADTFGSDSNIFDIDFVTIGNPNNAPDASVDANPDLPGSVSYVYRIGKYEISEDMIYKAVAEGGLSIATSNRGPNKPATKLTWIESIRFVNWLNTSTGNQAAYKLSGNTFGLWESEDPGYDSTNPYRNSLAKYFLPSTDEWYKAAFYDPNAELYYTYATGSNTTPVPVEFGTDPNTAVYGQKLSIALPADIDNAGALSPYGTMAQSGNVFEYEETDFDLVNDSSNSPRGARGGAWAWAATSPGFLSRTFRNSIVPGDQINVLGFRVASLALAGDFDADGVVDNDDLGIWTSAYGTSADGDADADGDSDGNDFLIWQRNFDGGGSPLIASIVSVPEPSSLLLSVLAVSLVVVRSRKSDQSVY